jgi:hypothetical protein
VIHHGAEIVDVIFCYHVVRSEKESTGSAVPVLEYGSEDVQEKQEDTGRMVDDG